MSRQNLEIVRRIWEAWERRDSEAAFAFYDPEVEATSTFQLEAVEAYRGHEGIRRWIRDWMEPFDDFHARAEEFIDAGESVVVRVMHGGRGRESGVYTEMPEWRVYTLRDGRVVRIESYRRKEEALKAAGLVG